MSKWRRKLEGKRFMIDLPLAAWREPKKWNNAKASPRLMNIYYLFEIWYAALRRWWGWGSDKATTNQCQRQQRQGARRKAGEWYGIEKKRTKKQKQWNWRCYARRSFSGRLLRWRAKQKTTVLWKSIGKQDTKQIRTMGESELIHRWQKTLTDRAAEQRFPCILSSSLVEGTRANPSDNRRHLSAVSNAWVVKVIETGGIGVISTLDENVACWGANWCEALRIIIYACLVGVGAWRSRLSETVISLAFPIIALTFHEDGWSQICRHETRKLLRFASKMIMCIERLYGPCAAWPGELVCVSDCLQFVI